MNLVDQLALFVAKDVFKNQYNIRSLSFLFNKKQQT